MTNKKVIILEAPFYSNSIDGERARALFEAFNEYSSDEIRLVPTFSESEGWIYKYTDLDTMIDENIRTTTEWARAGNTGVIDLHVYLGYPSNLQPKSENIVLLTDGVITTQPSESWKIIYEDFLDRVIVPTEFAKEGINTYKGDKDDKVKVVPFPSSMFIESKEDILTDSDITTKFNFLCSDELTTESNMSQLIGSFYKAFYNNPDVGLVLNTKLRANCMLDRISVMSRLKQIVTRLSDAQCKLYLVHGEVDIMNSEKINAYITTSHGITVDSGMSSAVSNKLPIICSDFGGIHERVKGNNGKAMASSYPYVLEDITTTIDDNALYGRFSAWATYKEENIAMAMVDMYNNIDKYKAQSEILHSEIKEINYLQELYSSVMENN